MYCNLVINMRKEVVMSEQEFNSLKNLLTIAKDTLKDEWKNDTLNSDGLYVLGLLNEMYDTLVWGLKE